MQICHIKIFRVERALKGKPSLMNMMEVLLPYNNHFPIILSKRFRIRIRRSIIVVAVMIMSCFNILTENSSLGTAISQTNYSMLTSSVDVDPATVYPVFQPSQNTSTDVTKGKLWPYIICHAYGIVPGMKFSTPVLTFEKFVFDITRRSRER